MSDIWFTSDTHFGHANIIRFVPRPWLREGDEVNGRWVNKKVAQERCLEMDDALIANWNERVKRGDIVYHAGDFAFCGSSEEIQRYLDRLNGTVFLVYGNHDKKNLCRKVKFAWQGERKTVKVGNQRIIVDHYAGRVWDKSHHGTWQLYGHSHGSLPEDYTSKSFDIGVDCHDYKPLNFEEVREIMKRYTFQPVDHHS